MSLPPRPHRIASTFNFSASSSGHTAHEPAKYVHAVQIAFAHSTQTVFHIMAAVMAVTFFVAIRFLKRGPEPAEIVHEPPDESVARFAR